LALELCRKPCRKLSRFSAIFDKVLDKVCDKVPKIDVPGTGSKLATGDAKYPALGITITGRRE